MAAGLVELTFARGARQVPADRWHACLVYLLRGAGELRKPARKGAADASTAGDGSPAQTSTGEPRKHGHSALSPTAEDDPLAPAYAGEPRKHGHATLALAAEDGPLALVNAGENGKLACQPGALALLARIDVRRLSRMLNDRAVRFFCEPDLKHQERYAELRGRLDDLLRTQAQHDDFAALHREEAELALVRCLLDGFAAPPAQPPTRGEQFCAYLDAHYDEPLSQAEVAASFGLSPEHFSRAFKQETGETFHARLTRVRLEAGEQLLAETPHTVSRIALDAGFPNIASFNQAFKRAHGTTPSAWRAAQQSAEATRELTDEAAAAFEPTRRDPLPHAHDTVFDLRLDAHAHADVSLPWGKVFAVGTPELLASTRARDQVRWLHERLGFRYARLACDVAQLTTSEGRHALEDALDYLLDLGVAVQFALEVGPGADPSACVDAIEHTLRGYANRYSVQNVRAWRYELRPHGGLTADDPAYITLFAQVHALLERLGVHCALIGPGVLLTAQAVNLRAFLHALRARGIEPGAVTIAARPAVPTGQAATDFVRTADRLFLRNQVLLASEALAAEGFDPALLQVGGWNDALETRNLMNDACAEGAALCQALLSCVGLVDSACYDWPSDLALAGSGRHDDYLPLSGKPGLLTRDGIPKPAFHALAFLSQIRGRVIHVSQRCAASTNDMGNYQVVCHNCERLGARYLATAETALSYEEMPSYFDDPRPRTARVRIQGAQPGTYLVKKRIVNTQGGSVIDAAARMRLWCMDDPSRSEIAYLRGCAQPQVELETVLCADGTIAFEHELASNEIAYFHVIFLY